MAVTIWAASDFQNQDSQKVYRQLVNATVPNAGTVALPVTAAGDANIATANANLATALQVAIRTLANKVVINISQGVVWDGAAFKGWATITYNP